MSRVTICWGDGMRASLLRTRAAVCLMVAAPIFAFAAPSAQAQATHGTFFFQNTEVGQEDLGDCFPGFYGDRYGYVHDKWELR